MHYWLVKTEPSAYSIDDLKKDGTSEWDGVRNAHAQQYLRQMDEGDTVLVYHSGKEKAVVGIAEVVREKYLDPTDHSGRLVWVDFKFLEKLDSPVTLAAIKATSSLKSMPLVRISRLSVMPVSSSHWRTLMKLAGHDA